LARHGNSVIQAGVLTISDRSSRGEREDLTGPTIADRLDRAGIVVKRREIVPDDYGVIVRTLKNWCNARDRLDLIITTGGTGLSPRDVTPEATLAVVERLVPGIPEALRTCGLQQTPHAMLSRGIAGTRGSTLIVNLPGSPRAVEQGLELILDALIHGIEIMRGLQE